MTTSQWITMFAKRLANNVVAPVWCAKCGTRMSEQPIGFREQGSRYGCPNPSCPINDLPVIVLGAN